jgi:hypothetical protein
MNEMEYGKFDDVTCIDCTACKASWRGDFYCKAENIIKSLNMLGIEANSQSLQTQGIDPSNILPCCPMKYHNIFKTSPSEV